MMKLLWLFCFGLLSLSAADQTFQLNSSFRSDKGKNIVFGAFVPGSSHVNWVLRFLDELTLRGHNVTFVTVNENLKFGTAYPRITTVSIQAPHFDTERLLSGIGSHPDITEMLPVFMDMFIPAWKPGYETTRELIDAIQADVVICDHFSEGCLDAAISKDIPLVLTSTLAMYPDADAGYINIDMATMEEFTTQDQSILTRLHAKFFFPLIILPKVKPYLEKLAQIKREANLVDAHYLDDPAAKTTHALKIVSSVFGLDPPRSTGPLVELVGPMFSTEYQPLTAEFEDFLAMHEKVVYVAFGQHAKPVASDTALVLTALIHQYEKGHIDGIIWSSGNAYKEKFPATLTSAYSGKTYDLAALFDPSEKKDEFGGHLLIKKWSPQMAVLLHPSVTAFVSHGGANSLVESLHAQKKLIFYPFFGDQPGTAKQLSRSGVSEYFDYKTSPAEIDARVEKVILDVNGTYQHNVRRYQALIQIHSKAAPSRAADLIEEAAYATQGARFPHREDVGRSIPFLKRYNLDLYAIALIAAGSLVGLVAWAVKRVVGRLFSSSQSSQKKKTL